MFDNIPVEMRAYNQWVVWRFEESDGDKPTKIPYSPINGRMAKVNDSSTWGSYHDALGALNSGMYSGLGFVLTEADPYGFIDLDDTKGDQGNADRQLRIYNEFVSYAERSPSGTGLHIIIKGSIPSGRKRSSIEVYSNLRFMTMTGNVFRNEEIKDYDALFNALWSQMGKGPNAAAYYAGLDEAKRDDSEVMEMARNAANAEKFIDLYDYGNWQKYYPSQSEADLALIDIIAFYSENRAQVKKLFLESKLGQREKSRAEYRLKYALDKCFDRMLPPVDIEGLRDQINAIIEKRMQNADIPQSQIVEDIPQNVTEVATPVASAFTVPPGLVGEIAQFIYAAAPRPVPEIALAGAIGLFAGIVGRAYNISGTGLNQYVLLLAGTGTGKEAISSGIDLIMREVVKMVPSAMEFIGPGEINSPQALIKYLSKSSKSFVSIIGEFGLHLQQMGSINASPHMLGLRRMLLDIYNKSGNGKVLKQSIYSDREKNTDNVLAPSVTLLGESTPERFYEGLHEGMITEGLLPRFTIIEYYGKRPYLNENHLNVRPDFDLIDKTAQVCANCLNLNNQHKAIEVQLDENANSMLKQFNLYVDDKMRASNNQVNSELWNRAHIKALKLSALIAVGCNPYDPVVNSDMATWAINLVLADVNNIMRRFDMGEVGVNNEETQQIVKLCETVKTYVISSWSEIKAYAGEGNARLHSERIITYAYLHKKLARNVHFKKDRTGATNAIKKTLQTMMDRGDLLEISKPKLVTEYGTAQRAFSISNPKAFGL